MENMVNFTNLYGGIYHGKKVLVTGHTGFKGSWLVYWLWKMGADVYGYALESTTELSHIDMIDMDIKTCEGDIRDLAKLKGFIQEVQPDIVFHLAAQALVRDSYDDPIETYSTNVMGTLHVLESCRAAGSVKAIVNVTTDKCYENKEWIWGYRENDPMGGYDPYSSSKGCAELLTASYRNSFFNNSTYKKDHDVLLASARAGNVIGGGDWAKDRLIPDIVKAANLDSSVLIRNPQATRPWQHVLEPLSGYLTLGWKLLLGHVEFAEGWNFGPDGSSNLPVGQIVELAAANWSRIQLNFGKNPADHHEANLLMLDCSKANKLLKWTPIWNINDTIDRTIGWYSSYYENGQINTDTDLLAYINSAQEKGLEWTKTCSTEKES